MTNKTTRCAMTALTVLTVAALTACASAPDANARTLEVGKGKTYAMPSAAIAAAQPGDTIAIAPGEYFDCAVVSKDHLTIEGVGEGVTITDKVCQGKALLVTAGNDIVVRNLTLTRARVPDHNGAGIRAEGTNLTVDHVNFTNNENGILAADNEASTIRVINSNFNKNGKCEASCAHGIYIGHIKLVRVENSHFTATHEGHHIKSRALQTDVIGTTIEDGPTGDASYEVEVPNGGGLLMENNIIEKGPNCGNHGAAIVVGAEGITQRTPEIRISNTTFTNDFAGDVVFLRNLSATEANITGSHFKGHKVIPLEGDGHAG